MGAYDLYWYDDATYQAGIHYYYPHTREIKDQWAFKACLIYCTTLCLLLPFGVALHQRRMRRKQERIKEESENTQTTADDTETPNSISQPYEIHRSQSAPERIVEAVEAQEAPNATFMAGWKLPFTRRKAKNPSSLLANLTKIPAATAAHNVTVPNPYFNIGESSSSSSSDSTSGIVRRSSSHAALTAIGSTTGGNNKTTTTKKKMPKTIDLCFGERPWYCFYISRPFWHKVQKCARWDGEMENILSLALPYTVSTVIENVFNLLEAGVIGRLLGTSNLTAYYIVDMGVGLATMFLHGMLSSLTVLVSHAIGAENYTLAGIYVQLSVWAHQIFFLPILIIGWYEFFLFGQATAAQQRVQMF